MRKLSTSFLLRGAEKYYLAYFFPFRVSLRVFGQIDFLLGNYVKKQVC